MVLPINPDIDLLTSLLEQEDFSEIFALADQVRFQYKGDDVQVRAILEFSNYCRRQCRYCGLNSRNLNCRRFRMEPEEMVQTAHEAYEAGYRTIVLQSGEDPWYTPEILGKIVREIKKDPIAVTVSCGEMDKGAYARLKACGADRYLIKHETADEAIYASLHPCGTLKNRVQCLKDLKSLGFETGSGFMIGLPGQTARTIARDLLLLREIPCDMAGIGPFIPHPDTELKDLPPGSIEMTKRAVALARLLLPECNLPATTSLGVLDATEKNHIFSCGANVIMRKITPTRYKQLYEIYPAQFGETNIVQQRKELEQQIRSLGRNPV